MKLYSTKEAAHELGIYISNFKQSANKVCVKPEFYKNKSGYWSEESLNKVRDYKKSLTSRILDTDRLLIIERFLTLRDNRVIECIKGTSVSLDAGCKIIDKYLKDRYIIVESKINKL